MAAVPACCKVSDFCLLRSIGSATGRLGRPEPEAPSLRVSEILSACTNERLREKAARPRLLPATIHVPPSDQTLREPPLDCRDMFFHQKSASLRSHEQFRRLRPKRRCRANRCAAKTERALAGARPPTVSPPDKSGHLDRARALCTRRSR